MAQSIDAELADLRAHALLRQLREVDSPQQPSLEFAGRKLVNFSSNDYLGLATEPVLRNAAKQAIDEYGVGSGASRLICGTLSPHMRLEEKLAEFKRTEAALTFSSGYATAVGTIGALMRKDDVIILDKLCHASLIDGAKMSGAAPGFRVKDSKGEVWFLSLDVKRAPRAATGAIAVASRLYWALGYHQVESYLGARLARA